MTRAEIIAAIQSCDAPEAAKRDAIAWMETLTENQARSLLFVSRNFCKLISGYGSVGFYSDGSVGIRVVTDRGPLPTTVAELVTGVAASDGNGSE